MCCPFVDNQKAPKKNLAVSSDVDSPVQKKMFRNNVRRLIASSWGWVEDVLPSGKTRMEEDYSQSAERIRRIFGQPLPAMPSDGSSTPEFLVGFSNYDHRLREQYRAAIAGELNTSVSAVSLSVGWSGRVDASKFRGVRKICGVQVATKTNKIDDLVRLVETRSDSRFLSLKITHAALTTSVVDTPQVNQDLGSVGEKSLMSFLAKNRCTVVTDGSKQNINDRCSKILQSFKVIPEILSVQELAIKCDVDELTCRTILSRYNTPSPFVFFDDCFVGTPSNLEYLHKNRKVLDSLLQRSPAVEYKQKRT